MVVRACLRRLGEREMERHDRLRALMVRLEADGQVDRLLRVQEDDHAARTGEEEQIQYPFFTKGTQELLKARVDIAQYSLPCAKARIEMAKRCHEDSDEDLKAEAELVVKLAEEFVLKCSEIGDDRQNFSLLNIFFCPLILLVPPNPVSVLFGLPMASSLQRF